MANEVRFKFSASETVTRELRKVSKEFDKLGGKGSSASLFGNVGALAVAKGFSLIGNAADAAVGFLGDSVRAAMEEEASQAALAASLKANVAGWDGATDAIDRHMQAQLRLGFTDDEQRQSLTLLVAATHDLNEAYSVMSVAMDLARFKHISLQDATEALTRVEGGSYRILKSLGIQLADNATQQDALTAVEKVAQGQAEAYADTLSGKMSAAQARVDQAMEKLGGITMPILATALDGLSNAFMFLSGDPSYQATGALKTIMDFIHGLTQGIGYLIHSLEQVIGLFYDLARTAADIAPNGRLGGSAVDAWRNGLKGHAAGGWVGLHGPEIGILGESGPEYVVPASRASMGLSSASGVILQGVTQKDIMRMVDQGLYFRLKRAGTGR